MDGEDDIFEHKPKKKRPRVQKFKKNKSIRTRKSRIENLVYLPDKTRYQISQKQFITKEMVCDVVPSFSRPTIKLKNMYGDSLLAEKKDVLSINPPLKLLDSSEISKITSNGVVMGSKYMEKSDFITETCKKDKKYKEFI